MTHGLRLQEIEVKALIESGFVSKESELDNKDKQDILDQLYYCFGEEDDSYRDDQPRGIIFSL